MKRKAKRGVDREGSTTTLEGARRLRSGRQDAALDLALGPASPAVDIVPPGAVNIYIEPRYFPTPYCGGTLSVVAIYAKNLRSEKGERVIVGYQLYAVPVVDPSRSTPQV